MSNDHRSWSAAVAHHSQSYLRLLLNICIVTVKWETVTACFFRIKTWKWHQKGIKICSGNPKFFRSITWISFQLLLNSWHYPFNHYAIVTISIHSKAQLCIHKRLYKYLPRWSYMTVTVFAKKFAKLYFTAKSLQPCWFEHRTHLFCKFEHANPKKSMPGN